MQLVLPITPHKVAETAVVGRGEESSSRIHTATLDRPQQVLIPYISRHLYNIYLRTINESTIQDIMRGRTQDGLEGR